MVKDVYDLNFLYGQETLTNFEWAGRAIVAFFFLLITARLMGQRSISQLRTLDFAIALVIGNIIAHPLSDASLGIKGAAITTAALLVLYLGSIAATLKWPWFRNLLTPSPIIIVKNGKISHEGLRKARISLDILLEELRQEEIEDVSKVALAMWEADGKFSVFLDPMYKPLTPFSTQMETQPFDFPKTIIKEGKINTKEVKQMQKSEEWVALYLKKMHQAEVKDVLYATLDSKDTLKIFLYK